MDKTWDIYDHFRKKFKRKEIRNILAVSGAIKIILSDKEKYCVKTDLSWKEVSRDKKTLLAVIRAIYSQNNVEIFDNKDLKKTISELNTEDYSTLIEFIEKNPTTKNAVKFCSNVIITSDTQLSEYKYYTPNNVFDVPLCMFDIESPSTIVNYFNGESRLLTDILNNKTENISYYGQDINEDVFKIGQLISYLTTGNKDNIRLGDSIREPAFIKNNELCKFDYSITIPPFSMPLNKQDIENDKFNRFIYGIPKRVSLNSDWIIIQHILASIKDGGKGAVLLPLGALYRSGAESIIRKKIITDDIIDAIVKLPPGIFSYTGIATCWIIFNRNKPMERKNKIQFIDLSEFTVDSDRRSKTISKEGIRLASKFYKNNEECSLISTFVSLTKIEGFEYDLNAFDHIKLEKLYSKFDDIKMIELSKVAKIRRGVQISRGKLDSLSVAEDRTHYLVNLGNIDEQNKIKLEENDRIKAESRWIDLYEVEKGDILITSRGSLFKVALVDENIENAIVSSNLFLIRVNKEKYRPEILKFFLDSDIGKKLIDGITKGSVVSSISNKDLENFLIPDIPLEDQEEAVLLINESRNKYEGAIKSAKREYQESQDKINKMLGLKNRQE